MAYSLLFTVFVIATCGLIYELICSTIASYLLGDSVTQFSIVIGIYLFSMGIGSYLAKYLKKNIIMYFIQVELLIGLIGGSSAALLFVSFEFVEYFRILLYSLISIIGILVGLEIPLLMRILKDDFEFSDLVSKVFAFDYIGALIASLLFPLFLIPHLGLIRSSFLFGVFNILVALWSIRLFKNKIPIHNKMQKFALFLLVLLLIGFAYSERIMSLAESFHYPDKVIYTKSSAYQRIVLTSNGRDLRLFLNGNLQFSSGDEYRYHEALVHIGLAALNQPKKVLVLGGGDGLAVREILKYNSIQKIILVDLDPAITKLFIQQNTLAKLNQNSLKSPKIQLITEDAFIWLQKNKTQKFDFIIVDFPDPSNYALGKLYTNKFYTSLKAVLEPSGFLVIQSTSPYYAKKSFWCIVKTLNSVGLTTAPYHAYIPSFGEWGYIIAGFKPFNLAQKYPNNLKFINNKTAHNLFDFPADMKFEMNNLQINKLNNQALVHYFEEEWSKV